MTPDLLPARMAKRLTVSEGGCWTWLGAIDRDGYGRVGKDGRCLRVHRVAYESLIGAIPEGLVIDHLCRNRACANPLHLEPVTVRENFMRGQRRFSGQGPRRKRAA